MEIFWNETSNDVSPDAKIGSGANDNAEFTVTGHIISAHGHADRVIWSLKLISEFAGITPLIS